ATQVRGVLWLALARMRRFLLMKAIGRDNHLCLSEPCGRSHRWGHIGIRRLVATVSDNTGGKMSPPGLRLVASSSLFGLVDVRRRRGGGCHQHREWVRSARADLPGGVDDRVVERRQ